ncbi:N-acetyltransferase [Yoonia sp.]|uniref:GNAT family N-acetyltransferase n=1 Tax=Yoonia sp. TaxID=2212373 RepID=UPI002398556F|nr:N-acetyltransferase [Yoonia sp.]MDE0850724.1 N-acetyltransferase [Yoonia sp.]
MQTIKIQLAREVPDDWWEVEELYDLTFAPGRTALSSYRLREDVAPLPELCLTARDPQGVLAGVVRCWPVLIGEKPTVLLGPIAVHPTRQGEGIAAILMMNCIDAARGAGWSRILLVGDAPYYRRFGFVPVADVIMPPPTNPDRVLGKPLHVGAWDHVFGHVTRAIDCIQPY